MKTKLLALQLKFYWLLFEAGRSVVRFASRQIERKENRQFWQRVRDSQYPEDYS